MSGGDEDHQNHMSDFEALMWNLEKNPALSNTFANVTLMDRAPDRARFVEKMSVAVHKVPKLRQRPVQPLGKLSNPVWEFDPDFDLHHHLRWVNLGGEADERQLYDYVALLSGQPFDRERPLWDFTIVEGLANGRAAMLQRLHHTITDGEGGIRLSVAFLDLERAPDEPDRPTEAHRVGPKHSDDPPPDEPTTNGGVAEVVGNLADSLRQRGAQLVDALGSAGSFVLHPDDAAAVARSTGRQAQVLRRCSPLWTERSLQRWFGTTSLDLAHTKELAHHLGGTVNDLFVTGAAAAAGAYHAEMGAEVAELRMSMPVSIRNTTESSDPMAGGNAFAPTQLLVPTGAMEPPERFELVHQCLDQTRSDPSIGIIDGMAAVINLLPTAALLATGERVTAGVDFVCSNVRAAPFDLYMGGALLEANYPVGPLAGTAFNLTTMSYRGTLWLGLHVDTEAVQRPELLLELLEAAYAELGAAQ